MVLAGVMISVGSIEDNARLRIAGYYLGFEMLCEFVEHGLNWWDRRCEFHSYVIRQQAQMGN